jgi:hypothetical protein
VTVLARDPDTGQEAKRDFGGREQRETGPDPGQRELLRRVPLCE